MKVTEIQKSTLFFACFLLSFCLLSVALSGNRVQDNKVHKACRYLLKEQYTKAKKLLHDPQTAQEKGLYALLLGKDSVRERSFGLKAFDINKAHILAKEVLAHLQKDAEENALSARILGSLYYNGIGVEKNNEKAFRYYLQAAEKDEPMAMNNVGVFYFNGIAIKKDKVKAVKWFRRAAKHGNTIAMNTMAALYMQGNTVNKDQTAAKSFYKKAAKLGNSVAMYFNGTGIIDRLVELENREQKSKLKRRKRKHHQANSHEKLKVFMNSHFKKAAEEGFVPAMILVGSFYETGLGCKQSDNTAFEWYIKAADSNLAEPLFLLARCYRNGIGTQKNAQYAEKLFNEAKVAAKKQDSKVVLEKIALFEGKNRFLQNAELVLLDWSWHSEHGYAIVNGQVKNISEKPIHNVTALVSFKTKADKLVTSDSSLIEYNPIMPGQVSPFKIISVHNPLMATASIDFMNLFGRMILWYTGSDEPEPLLAPELAAGLMERL